MKKRGNLAFRSREELIENYCALPPAQRRFVLRVIAALSKIPK